MVTVPPIDGIANERYTLAGRQLSERRAAMKRSILIAVVALVVGFGAGYGVAVLTGYEFRSSGPMIWRCNRMTGKAWRTGMQDGTVGYVWYEVVEP